MDLICEPGIVVLSESERSLLLDLMRESIDRRIESENPDRNNRILESLELYNKIGIGKVADSTIEHEFGIYKLKKEEKHGKKKSRRPVRRSKRNQ